jgi:hypothetical protein
MWCGHWPWLVSSGMGLWLCLANGIHPHTSPGQSVVGPGMTRPKFRQSCFLGFFQVEWREETISWALGLCFGLWEKASVQEGTVGRRDMEQSKRGLWWLVPCSVISNLGFCESLQNPDGKLTYFSFFFSFFFCGTGVWTQGLYLEPLHQPFFVLDLFKIGSLELFAWAGFELWSS